MYFFLISWTKTFLNEEKSSEGRSAVGTTVLGLALTKCTIKPTLWQSVDKETSLALHLPFSVTKQLKGETHINQETIITEHINKRKHTDLLDKAKEGILK